MAAAQETFAQETLPDLELPRYTAGAVDYAPVRGLAAEEFWEEQHVQAATCPHHVDGRGHRGAGNGERHLHGISANSQDRPGQQLFGISRPGGRRDAEGHRPLRQGAREGSAAGRQDRDHQARRCGRPRGRQTRCPGADHARSRPDSAGRGRVADRRRHRAADPGSQNPAGHHQCGRCRHTAYFSLCGALLIHALAAGLSARPMGRQAKLEDRLYGGERFHSRP